MKWKKYLAERVKQTDREGNQRERERERERENQTESERVPMISKVGFLRLISECKMPARVDPFNQLSSSHFKCGNNNQSNSHGVKTFCLF